MHTKWLAVTALGLASVACGMASNSASFGAGEGSPSAAGDAGKGSGGGDFADAGSSAPTQVSADGIILVHAGSMGSFRLCFAGSADQQPTPDSTIMPAANLVGVEVGTAVRVPSLKAPPGAVTLYPVALIKGLYQGSNKPSCADLARDLAAVGTPIGAVDADLSRGLHVLAVTGCPANGGGTTRTQAECGPDFDGAKPNLAIKHLTIDPDTNAKEFRARVVNLSRPAESARGAAPLDVTFAPSEGGAATPVASNVAYLERPATSAPLQVTSNDEAYYASASFKVTAGATTLLTQSLADVQKLSQPDEVPSTYFAHASSYLMMLVGDPDPKLAGGAPDPDPLRKLHFLAIPVVDPAAETEAPSP